MKYRKKPVVIEAIKWTGSNLKEIFILCGKGEFTQDVLDDTLDIKTLEGTMKAQIGDWIIKGIKGEFYPCKPDIFEATYDPVVTNPEAVG